MTQYRLRSAFLRVLVGLLGCVWSAGAQVNLTARWNEQAPANRSNPLSLEEETLRTTIDNQHATTVILQRYKNASEQVLEAECVIRAGSNSKVQGFAYWNGETKIRGEVFEKEAAAEVYAQTTGRRRDPGLVEQTGEGTFAFRVFPIQPREQKRVEITLSQRLWREGSHVEYRVPLASPAATISVTLLDSRKWGRLVSATHRLEVETLSGRTVVTATPQTKKEKEFVLAYDIEEPAYRLSVVKHQDAGQSAYLAISLATEAVAQRSAKDVTIVLDRSGSMSGAPMNEARAAAKEIVSKLTSEDHLNVIAFDDRVNALFPRVQTVTESSRKAALGFLDAVTEGGGTDIGLALEEALKRQRSDAERPLVLLLTDGASDAAKVFAVAEQDHSKVRVFTVGLGPGVNRPLLSRLSDLKRGRFTYIQSAEAIRASINRLFGLVETTALRAPELSIEQGQLLDVQPSTLPDLAPGEELLVTARAIGTGAARLSLHGWAGTRRVEAQTQVELGTPERHPWVGRLWAQERTNRILEEISLKGETTERKNEAIELAVAYGFVTPYTSFLAIPEQELIGTTSDLMRDMREQKRAILAKRSDAVALSRSEMPPGDPVLTVDAPADARRVTAFFPFGLEKDLKYDPEIRLWRVRFLVPKEVPDGNYSVPVMVIRGDGQIEFKSGNYTIDSTAPEFLAQATCHRGQMEINVETQQPLREVWAALTDDPTRRVRLQPSDPSLTRYTGRLRLPPNTISAARVVVTDRARNESDEIVRCEAPQP